MSQAYSGIQEDDSASRVVQEDDSASRVVRNVIQIVANIEEGDCPYSISNAFIYCRLPHDICAPGAFVVYCLYDHDEIDGDLKVFRYLTASLNLYGPSTAFYDLLSQNISVQDAIIQLVDSASSMELISERDISRLKSKYLVWMKGISKVQCMVAPYMRKGRDIEPGWPWDDAHIKRNALMRNTEDKNIAVWIKSRNMCPVHSRLVQIWDRDQQLSIDISQCISEAVLMAQQYIDEHTVKQQVHNHPVPIVPQQTSSKFEKIIDCVDCCGCFAW